MVDNYTYPAAGAGRPHGVASVTRVGGATVTYGYDARGNTITRAGLTGGDETLAWDSNNRLRAVTKTSGGVLVQSQVQDPSGRRLARVVGNLSTVYHTDGTEVTRNTSDSGTTLAQRYYSFGGRTVGHRDAGGSAALTNVTTDAQGTPSYAYKNATGSFVTYRKLPFGGLRGSDVLPGERRFVGGTWDAATSLIQIGTRPYDPVQGRFLTVDPVMDSSNPAQVAGAYSYGWNDPIANADATGNCPNCPRCPDGDCGGGPPPPKPPPYTGGTPTGGYDDDYQEDHPVDQTDNNTPDVGDGEQQSEAGSGASTGQGRASAAAGVAGDVASGASGAYLANIANQATTASAAHLRYAEELRLMARRSGSPPRSSQLSSASGKAANYADDFKSLSGTAKFGSKVIPGLGIRLTAVSEFSDPADRSTKERVANTALISGSGAAVGAGVTIAAGAACVASIVCGGVVVTGALAVGIGAGASWAASAFLHHTSGWFS